ncbi:MULTISPECIES: PPC domain-containing DNA-binding protein [Mycetohabitans]|uniref:PPC domain-containing DNA-binding protein n=1 Tax=Mycetohabitans TaxID=2571159 RepID=UPI001F48A4A0|nr:PPC domain-containing DNA-binding protein [Mycetohabitans sp. B3]MCF2132675.1 DNA-binding protein [Mycetohabitans sp. B3]
MKDHVMIESGRLGRLVVARVKPNEDLITSLEHLCDAHGVERALVRGAVGSLLGATLLLPQRSTSAAITVEGPGVEILSLSGEISRMAATGCASSINGMVADPNGRMFAGRLQRGGNRSFITIEVSLQEWLVDSIIEGPATP